MAGWDSLRATPAIRSWVVLEVSQFKVGLRETTRQNRTIQELGLLDGGGENAGALIFRFRFPISLPNLPNQRLTIRDGGEELAPSERIVRTILQPLRGRRPALHFRSKPNQLSRFRIVGRPVAKTTRRDSSTG
jgi:hypothetical protein